MAKASGGAVDARIALIGVPFDDNSSFAKGAAEAPSLIRSSLFSDATNLWCENGLYLGQKSLLLDAGDVTPAAGADMFNDIEAAVKAALDRNMRPIVLGGDHSITYPVVKAVARTHPDLTILDFDAHPDLYDEYMGNRRSHACPFARIMEDHLALRLVQVGIRAMNDLQRLQSERFGVEVVAMKNWRDALPALRSPVYISFDLDALDPAFAPGVVHREPGGLSVRQALSAIQSIEADVVGADLVEFNPRYDPANVTAAVGAKLLKELAAKMLQSRCT